MRSLAALILLALPAVACGGTGEGDTPSSDEVQIVEVTVEGSAYVFSPASVQADKPVRLVFDPAGLPGCSSSVTLPDYDIAKTIVEDDTFIEFTPHGTGPVAVVCAMNMYKGTLQAE